MILVRGVGDFRRVLGLQHELRTQRSEKYAQR